MLPEKSQGKVLQATVVAVGSGSKGKVTWGLQMQL